MSKRPSLPSISTNIASDLRNFLNRVRELLDGKSDLVTREDLIESGAFSVKSNGRLIPETTETSSCTQPPAPVNVSASGAMTSIFITWDGSNYDPNCFDYAEIWRSTENNFGTAYLTGTTKGDTYIDPVGSQASYYYWVRLVNKAGVAGKLQGTQGIQGSTAPDLDYVFAQLSEAFGSNSAAPFFQLDEDTEIDGVTIPAGTYIKTAMIYDGSIKNAHIGAAAIQTANIADAAIQAAKIANATITGAKIALATIESANIKEIYANKIKSGSLTVGTYIKGGTYFGSALRIGAGGISRLDENGDPGAYATVFDSDGSWQSGWADKFLKFEGGEIKMGRKSQIEGVNSYDNTTYYMEIPWYLFLNEELFQKTGSIVGAVETVGTGLGCKKYSLSNTSGSLSLQGNTAATFSGVNISLEWRLKMRILVTTTSTAELNLYINTFISPSSSTAAKIGFSIRSGNLYTYYRLGTGLITQDLLSSISATMNEIELVHLDGVITYYLNGSQVGTLNVNFTGYDVYATSLPRIDFNNTGSSTISMTLGDLRIFGRRE